MRTSALIKRPSPRAKFTSEGGSAIWVVNGTGAPSEKGLLVSSSTAADKKVTLQDCEFDTIGIMYEDGIPVVAIDVPSASPVVAEHFKECGHVRESKSSGTKVLVECFVHFN